MNIKLSDHFTYLKLIKFVLPSIFMMIFTSIYGVVDGFFVSNYAGKLEFIVLKKKEANAKQAFSFSGAIPAKS